MNWKELGLCVYYIISREVVLGSFGGALSLPSYGCPTNCRDEGAISPNVPQWGKPRSVVVWMRGGQLDELPTPVDFAARAT